MYENNAGEVLYVNIPVISIIGWSGVGKTTFFEKLIKVLKEKGIRLGVVKQDGHEFDVDKEGKDTWRFSKAGADEVAIYNGKHGAVMLNRPTGLDDVLGHMTDVDLIITEGCHEREFPQIEVHRACFDRLRCDRPGQLIALVTDEKLPNEVPQFSFSDLEKVADFILAAAGLDDECAQGYRDIVAGRKAQADGVRLTVDGREVAMMPFVQDIIREVNVGLLKTLRDADAREGSEVTIEIKL